MMAKLLMRIIRAYQLLLSPWLGAGCRFEPSCSNYMLEALQTHGPAHGSYLGAKRLLRCGPWCSGGFDPVPSKKSLFSSLI